MIAVTFSLQVAGKHDYLPVVNHYIPDSYAYELRVLYDRTIDPLSDGFTYFNRALYAFGSFSFLILNTLMLLASVYLCQIFKCISLNSVALARFIIVFNPYLLIGAIGPNKETVLVVLSLLSFYFFFRQLTYLKLIGISVAILALFVRPVFGLVLVTTLLMGPFISFFKNPVSLFLFILSFYFIINSIPAVNFLLTSAHGDELQYFQGSNLLQIALFLQVMSQNPVLQLPAFAVKTGLILITPIFRPNPFFSFPFPILDGGYTFMAYCLFPLNLALLSLFFNKSKTSTDHINKKAQILILYCLIGILTTIINPNITFRYIFPYSPILAALFYLHTMNYRNRILVSSCVIVSLTFFGTLVFFRKSYVEDLSNSIVPQFMSWF